MPEPNEPLSERELEILRLVATGAANKEIASQLVISPNTVKVHLRNIFAKIGVSSRTEATLYAVKVGLVQTNTAQAAPEEAPAPSVESTYLPGIVVEDGSEAVPTPHIPAARQEAKPLRLILVILAVLILTGAATAGLRLLTAQTILPTVASQSATISPDNQRWAKKADLPAPRKGMGAVEYENSFYVIAGETPSGPDGAVLRYDPTNNRWESLKKKPTPVTEVQAVLLGEKIYVPGGRLADGRATDSLEVYNPRSNNWESKSRIPAAVSAYALAAFEGQLYLFGGKNGEKYSAAVYAYNPQTDQWTPRTAMSTPRAYAGAAVNGGKILIMGGYNGKNALRLNEAYFPTRDGSDEAAWEALAPMPQARYAMGIGHLANLVFLFGGLNESGVPGGTLSGMQYQIQTDQWAEFEKPPITVGGLTTSIASGNYLYLLGGETAQGLSANTISYQAIYTLSVPVISKDKGK